MEGKKKSINLLTTKEEETLIKSHIEFYYRMGYDFVPGLSPSLVFLWMFKPKTRKTRDTAALSKTFDAFSGDDAGGNRVWIEETQGIITSWEDMPWAVQILLVTICLFQIIWLC